MNSLSLFVTCILFSYAFCTPIDIYSTGTNNDGSSATQGSVDQHWTITSTPYGGATTAYVAYSGDDSLVGYVETGAQWIATDPNVDQGFAVGNFVFQTTFDLTGLDPTTAVLSGIIAADDVATFYLNGNAFSGCSSCWYYETSFTIDSGFISGINTLQVVVYNTGGPFGLSLEISGYASAYANPQAICDHANEADWGYGQGYYCFSANTFIQCWGDDPRYVSTQPCALGTTCQCSSPAQECSQHGTVSPCQ